MESKKVLVRMPATLVEDLDVAARNGRRSRTAEIVKRLEESFQAGEQKESERDAA